MDSRKSNKIMEIVRLQQILKKWKKLANKSKTSSVSGPTSVALGSGSKSIKFLKKTLSFTESSISSSVSSDQVPKGYIAVCTGKELKRFVIPMEYLGHQAFRILLREAEEEFGFQQEGVLKIPCEVELFEKILKLMEEKKDVFFLNDSMMRSCYSPDCDLTSPSHHPQTCS
ncbi:unnamed protein product [Fraxinus pennsylvanica]|uniref:Small auxin up regulated protein n=1 Tax=Fraxinus pennsylvanica TaxID=56036 RepID=A0AAD2DJX1_9LAMI|nr:unnamed protein product [Fraxinus pennsylvanica]